MPLTWRSSVPSPKTDQIISTGVIWNDSRASTRPAERNSAEGSPTEMNDTVGRWQSLDTRSLQARPRLVTPAESVAEPSVVVTGHRASDPAPFNSLLALVCDSCFGGCRDPAAERGEFYRRTHWSVRSASCGKRCGPGEQRALATILLCVTAQKGSLPRPPDDSINRLRLRALAGFGAFLDLGSVHVVRVLAALGFSRG